VDGHQGQGQQHGIHSCPPALNGLSSLHLSPFSSVCALLEILVSSVLIHALKVQESWMDIATSGWLLHSQPLAVIRAGVAEMCGWFLWAFLCFGREGFAMHAPLRCRSDLAATAAEGTRFF
jgi:hypothetical protein